MKIFATLLLVLAAFCASADMDSIMSYLSGNFHIFTEKDSDNKLSIGGAMLGFRPPESSFGINIKLQQVDCMEGTVEDISMCLQLFGTEIVYYPKERVSIGLGYDNRNENRVFMPDNRLQLRLKIAF